MDRKFLEEMGIEKENIDKILNKYHEGVKEYKDNAEKVTTLETEITSLKSQIDERDKDLEELKKVDAEGLQNKITELENKNKTLKEESDKQLLETRKSLMIENSLISSKAKNLKAIKGLLDLDKISFENDKLKKEVESFMIQKPATPQPWPVTLPKACSRLKAWKPGPSISMILR